LLCQKLSNMKNVDTGFAKSKYLEVSELGSRYNLSFSSQLVLGDKLIALDGVRKCLLVIQTDKEVSQPTLIDLNKVSAVTVRKNYGRINQGELKNRAIDEFLERVDLHFLFRNNSESLVLPFYDSERDDEKDRGKLARNAKNWQMILSKMVGQKI
jgi:hypothetical protein